MRESHQTGLTPNPIDHPLRLVCRQEPHEAEILIHPWIEKKKGTKRKVENPTVNLKGQVLTGEDFFQPLAREVIDDAFDHFCGISEDKELGIYEVYGEDTKDFATGDLVIDGVGVKSIQLKVRQMIPLRS